MARSLDIVVRDAGLSDRYDRVPNEIEGEPIPGIVAEVVARSRRHIARSLGEDPTTYVYPGGRKGRRLVLQDAGFQYFASRFPSLPEWSKEMVLGSRVTTLYVPEAAVLRSGRRLDEASVRLLHKLPEARAVRMRKDLIVQDTAATASRGGEHWLLAPAGNGEVALDAIEALPADSRPSLVTNVDWNSDDLRASAAAAAARGLGGIQQKYLWRDLTHHSGFARRQPVKKALAPFALRQRPTFGDEDLPIGDADRSIVAGWFNYWRDDHKLARHLNRHLQLVKPGGRLIFDDTKETPGVGDITRVFGWELMANRDLDRLHDNVLAPNIDQIASVCCINLDEVFRVMVVEKA